MKKYIEHWHLVFTVNSKWNVFRLALAQMQAILGGKIEELKETKGEKEDCTRKFRELIEV